MHSSHKKQMYSTAIILALLGICIMLAVPLSVVSSLRGIKNYLPLHMLLETISIVIALLIFAVGFHTRYRNLPGNIVLLACAFFGVGLLDFMHMLSYAGMPDFVTPANVEKALDFWLAARLMAAAALFAAVIMPWRPYVSRMTRYRLFAAVLAMIALASWLFLFHQDKMPRTFITGQGLTAFKLAFEYFFIALNLATALMLWVKMRRPLPFNAAALFGAVCAMAMSAFLFTLYANVTDVYNLLGHVCKVVSYLFLYRAIFVTTIEMPYHQLQASETKLRTLFESTSDAVMLVGEKNFLDCNNSALELFGCATVEELRTKHPGDISPPKQPCGGDSKTLAEQNNAIALEKGSNHFEWVCRRVDTGETFPADMLLNRMELDGRMVLQATVRDISGRKKSEDALRKLSLAVEQSPASVVITDLDANIEYVNQAFIKETGYSSEEVIGQNPRILNSGKNPEETYREMWAYLMRGEIWRGELVNRRKDGSEYVESALISPVHDGGGKITHYLSIMENITARKASDAKIERLSQAYRLLSRVNEAIVRAVDEIGLFSAICDAATESGLFRLIWIGMLDEKWVVPVKCAGMGQGYLNDKFNIMLGSEQTGQGPIARSISEGTHVVCQDIEHDPCMAPWRDGAMKHDLRSSAAFPIYKSGAACGAISVYAAEAGFFTADIIGLMLELAADVSFALDVFVEKQRRERAEDEIREFNAGLERRVGERTYQLEQLNRELEAFSYSVSHDLRAPLRSIDGFSRILLNKYHGKIDATGQDWLERVSRASQHMGHLIDDMLKLSQVARAMLKREEVGLSRLAEEVADELRSAHPQRVVRFDLQQDITVHADSGLMRILMNNLLGNAHKYTGKKTEAEIAFGERYADGERVFFVRDNGTGFNMEYAHKLFGAFQRLHPASEFDGTGIGLATVQRIVHRHHGRIWVEAIEGQGATFYFTLPQREREA